MLLVNILGFMLLFLSLLFSAEIAQGMALVALGLFIANVCVYLTEFRE